MILDTSHEIFSHSDLRPLSLRPETMNSCCEQSWGQHQWFDWNSYWHQHLDHKQYNDHQYHRQRSPHIYENYLTNENCFSMDVMTAVASQSCLDLTTELDPPQPMTGGREDSLESAQYLGSVTTDPEPVTGDNVASVTAPYLQFVENTDLCSGYQAAAPGAVYVSPSLYPSSSSPPSTTYYDTLTPSYTGLTGATPAASNNTAASQSQLVSYAGTDNHHHHQHQFHYHHLHHNHHHHHLHNNLHHHHNQILI